MANRLINEKSPYLLQHAHNPVDWYPWGEEAFRTAREQDKPIFLSVGYSTCHWCHVMEKESFESADVAELMNKDFISIKVDREERPDVDAIYMSVCQMLTGRGGWPMTIIMTPEKKPFFAATYIPRTSIQNSAGMLQLLPAIAEIWRNKRSEIDISAEQICSILRQAAVEPAGGTLPVKTMIDTGFDEIAAAYDSLNGGFGKAPKFPTPHNLLFMLRYAWRYDCNYALKMVENTLTKMRNGGIYDQLGSGFHRYSTDAEWHVPHFEKMLYDQALTLEAYLEAFEVTGKTLYADTSREIINYVLRDMRSPDGGFYSGEDADSAGGEGRFYIWTFAELKSALTESEFSVLASCTDISEAGNYLDEAAHARIGGNILRLRRDASAAIPDEMRNKLFQLRVRRIRPSKDTKILTDWNALMIGALAHAARTLKEQSFLAAAEQAIRPVLDRAAAAEYRLAHCYDDGNAAIPGMLDDYSFVIAALLELYHTTRELAWLNHAEKFCAVVQKHFTAAGENCYYMTAGDAEPLIIRPLEVNDGVIPSGNSMMLHNNLKLAYYSGNSCYAEIANKMIHDITVKISRNPSAYLHALAGFITSDTLNTEMAVVTSPTENASTSKILKAADSYYNPSLYLLVKTPENEAELAQFAPFTKSLTAIDGKTTAYICRNKSCALPLTSEKEILRQLKISHDQFSAGGKNKS